MRKEGDTIPRNRKRTPGRPGGNHRLVEESVHRENERDAEAIEEFKKIDQPKDYFYYYR